MYILVVDDENSTEDEAVILRIEDAVKSAVPHVECKRIRESELAAFCDEACGVEHPIKVQCFGEFEVFYGEKPLSFKRARTKELFAVLVCHRGSMLSMGTLLSILWEDGCDSDSERSYLRTMISDLRKTFEEIGADDIIIKKYNSIGINIHRISCDYYDFLDGKEEAVERYNGHFMKQYSWAEYELSLL